MGALLRDALALHRGRLGQRRGYREHPDRLALTITTYGAVNTALSRYGARTGLTVELFSRSLFGVLGFALATLIFAATTIYYAVFEGSIIAAAFQSCCRSTRWA